VQEAYILVISEQWRLAYILFKAAYIHNDSKIPVRLSEHKYPLTQPSCKSCASPRVYMCTGIS
jgi:hypothetical protein